MLDLTAAYYRELMFLWLIASFGGIIFAVVMGCWWDRYVNKKRVWYSKPHPDDLIGDM